MNDPHQMPRGGDWLPRLARCAVAERLLGTCPEATPAPEGYLARKAGIFVTIRTRDGRLRGCRGSLEASGGNLIEETRQVALTSAIQDGRFEPVTAEELEDLVFEVSVLHPPEPVPSLGDLDPARYGVIVLAEDGRRGVMLPGVEGLDTAEQQVEATRRKACIFPGEKAQLLRFQVDKFLESQSTNPAR